MMYVYKITNKINGKVYIGQTVRDFRGRWSSHLYNSKKIKTKRSPQPIHVAMNKYGTDSFEFEVLELCNTKQMLNDAESQWIEIYRSLCPNGYNLRVADDRSSVSASESTKKKMSDAKRGCKVWNKGLKHRPAHLNSWRKSMEEKGHFHKIGDATRGVKHSKERSKKSSIARSKKHFFISPWGEFFEVDRLIEFCDNYGLSRSSMIKVSNGSRASCFGWKKAIQKSSNSEVLK